MSDPIAALQLPLAHLSSSAAYVIAVAQAREIRLEASLALEEIDTLRYLTERVVDPRAL